MVLVWRRVDGAGNWLGPVIDGACGSCTLLRHFWFLTSTLERGLGKRIRGTGRFTLLSVELLDSWEELCGLRIKVRRDFPRGGSK